MRVLTPPAFEQAIQAGNDPSPQDVQRMRDLLTGRRVRALLYESSRSSP